MRITLTWAAVPLLAWQTAMAETPRAAVAPCEFEAARQEAAADLPAGLLTAIAVVESGRRDAPGRPAIAWPWTVGSNGAGRYFETLADAVAEVERLQAQGVRNIDVGCMQVNLLYHGEAFGSLAEAFDPAANVAYAAEFLKQLKATSPSWMDAAGRYHSATPRHRDLYKAKLAALWGEAEPPTPGSPPSTLAGREYSGGRAALPPGMDWEWIARLQARLAFARDFAPRERAAPAPRGADAASELAAAFRAAAPASGRSGPVPRNPEAGPALAELRARLSALARRDAF